ncbi:MAG: diguanylate cyclase [Pseudomonadota bacterium]
MTRKSHEQTRVSGAINALTVGYVLALALIGAIAATAHIVTGMVIDSQSDNALVVNVSGRQRMLSQRIVLLAQSWAETGSPAAKKALSDAISMFETSHERIVTGTVGSETQTVPNTVLSIMNDPPHELDQAVRDYVALAKAVRDRSPDADIALDALGKTVEPAAAQDITLLDSLNDVVTAFEVMHTSQISRMKQIQNAALLVLAIALILEALLIFRPLIQRINGLAKSLSKASITDPMTSIYNRRGFMTLAEQKMKSSLFGALIVLDIDHFKKINDLHGHAAGDACIVHTTQICRSVFRHDDVVGRIGGEEFAIAVPGAPERRVLELAEQLREQIASTPCDTRNVKCSEDSVSFTISVGVCFYHEPHPLTELLQNADAALYDAKRDGRNRVQSSAALSTMTFHVGAEAVGEPT